jgi:hypothetical protein
MYPVNDPQAVREPRPDNSYLQSGNSGIQVVNTGATDEDGFGFPEGGSRVFQWGWAPVGGSRENDDFLTPNNLVINVEVGTVSITVT